MRFVFRFLLLMVSFFLVVMPCCAKLYKYQKDGVWYFTDSPPREVLQQSEVMDGGVGSTPSPTPEGTPLLTDYPARNPMEKATAATVAVKGGLGYGSGFFVSNDGFILTNKHVVRTTENQKKQENVFFGAVDGRIEEAEKKLAEEKQRLGNFEAKLNELKRLAKEEKQPLRKKSYNDEYAFRNKTYQEAKSDYENRRKKFKSEKKNYLSQRSDYDYSKAVANLSRNFEIILADNTRLNARLVATSASHDLALLKVDGYKTPALKTTNAGNFPPGRPLYAVGNPAKLKNSVTSGIFSGFERGFIKTNAQIYPGNSGGPLVTKEGMVVGINTFKELTYKFEGLGFAIPVGKAFDEFARYLR